MGVCLWLTTSFGSTEPKLAKGGRYYMWTDRTYDLHICTEDAALNTLLLQRVKPTGAEVLASKPAFYLNNQCYFKQANHVCVCARYAF
jgi:hypothetical protein